GEGLVGKKHALNRPRRPGQHFPVRAELERHYDPGDDTEAKGYAKDLEPEFEDDPIGGPPDRKIQRFENGEPRRQPDRERREDDVERYRERELEPRQEKCREVHRSAPSISPRAWS